MSTPTQIKYSGPVISPEVPWETRRHLQLLYQKLGNHTQAFQLQQKQIANLKPGSTTTNITESGGGGGGGGGGSSSFLGQGFINDQSGQTGYATTPGDNGILLIVNDSSPVAVSLTTDSAPFYLFITNFGVGTATLTPSTGLINGAASLDLLQNQTVYVSCDSTNWDSTALSGPSPQDTPQITHEWLDSYTTSTGAFTQSQPAASDVTNAADVTVVNTFVPNQHFQGGIQIGTAPQVANLNWTLGTFALTALLGGTVPIGLGFQVSGTFVNMALQAQTAELGFGMLTVVGGSTYGVIQLAESNPANFLSATNTVEYQFGAQKNGTPGTTPPPKFAVGDVQVVSALPLVVSAANLITGAASGTCPLGPLTGGGTPGSLTIVNGLITAFTPPT